MLAALSVSASAEIVYDDEWGKDIIEGFLESIVSSGTTSGVKPQLKPQYSNINNASLNFYINNRGTASVLYTVSSKNTSTEKITVSVTIEKHLTGPFWYRLPVKYTDTFHENYHSDSFEYTVGENGRYRAVMSVNVGKDEIVLSAECDYEKGKLTGDINLDGRVTAYDARLVLRCSARLDTTNTNVKKYGDINADGKITSADARLVLKISAGL